MQGRVKAWFPHNHYGFIQIDGGMEFFFHGTAVARDYRIRTHDAVEFWLDDDPLHRGNLIGVDIKPLPRSTVNLPALGSVRSAGARFE
jgi:cold shock CspA family protein